mmetsp:Transcript_22631/g.42630  ORF Transcript_22631/g.42630 Transcript_22631/m.42630 type:complete len:154 (-) Transcript_22631:119-580(-)
MAVGYDPIQRSQQWKRRVDREELSVCQKLLTTSQGVSPDQCGRADLFQHKAVLDSVLHGAGMALAQTTPKPAMDPRCTPLTRSFEHETGSSSSSAGLSSFREEYLEAQLLQEKHKLHATRQELRRLQQLIKAGSATPGSSRFATPRRERVNAP